MFSAHPENGAFFSPSHCDPFPRKQRGAESKDEIPCSEEVVMVYRKPYHLATMFILATTFIALALLLLGSTGCLAGSSSQATPTPTAGSGTPIPARTVTGGGSTPEATGTTTGTLGMAVTPTPSPPPTLTPTPEAPTATPVPTLTPEMARALSELQSKLEDLQMAVRSQDRTNILRAQRDALEALARAERLAPTDNSALADRVRTALSTVREGASGDLAKLGDGQAKLRQLVGGAPRPGETAAATPMAGFQPITDLAAFAGGLADKVRSLSNAYRENRTGDLLRLQREILDEMNRGEMSLRGDNSRMAEDVRNAMAEIRNGLAGDLGKLGSAEAKLRQLSGRPGEMVASPSPTPQPVDVQPLANELSNRLGPVRDAYRNKDREALSRAQQELREQADRVERTIQGDRSPRAERLRQALGIVREVAAGDMAKIDAAEQAMKAAMQ